MRLASSRVSAAWSMSTAPALPITDKSFGLHALYYPLGATSAPDIAYGTVRTHDWNGAYTSGGGCFAVSKWCNVEIADNTFDWSDMDSFVAAHAGRDIVWTMDGTPSWAVAAPAGRGFYKNKAGSLILGSNVVPDSTAQWSAWATALATRYAATVKHYEVWNEPEFPGSSASYWTGSAAQMAQMMRLAYQSIKTVNSSLQVISPSISTDPARVDTLFAASDGASGTGAQWFDILGFHAYASGSGSRQLGVEHLYGRIKALRASLAAVGRASVPIWSTEHGVQGGALATLSDAERRRWLRKYFATYFALGVERVIFFAYDSGSMGLVVPGSYDMRPAWTEITDALLGRTVLAGRIEANAKSGSDWRITLDLSDGSTFIA